MTDLDVWTVPKGYPGAVNPHRATRDLVYVYAAGLRNAGGPGPTWSKFATLVTAAIESQWIRGNRLFPFSLQDLARASGDILNQNPTALVAGNGAHYQLGLEQMTNGQDISPQILQSLLTSVNQFCDLLTSSYQGQATVYHQSFSQPYPNVAQMMAAKWMEIRNFVRIGPAVGMNFFKDAQGSALDPMQIQQWPNSPLAWFVKADMHVSRLMLCETARAAQVGISTDVLTHLPINEVFANYVSIGPGNGHAPEPSVIQAMTPLLAEWSVVAEVHHWAIQQSVSALEIDRILYLIGSGRFDNHKLSTPQLVRYARFCNLGRASGRCTSSAPAYEVASEVEGVPVQLPDATRHDTEGALEKVKVTRKSKNAKTSSGTVDARSSFFQRIENNGPATAFAQRVATGETEPNWELHHTMTNGGDLRIRAPYLDRQNLRFQNIFTMDWKPANRVFKCSIYSFDLNFLAQYAFIDNYQLNETVSLRHQFNIKVPEDSASCDEAADQLLELIGIAMASTIFGQLHH